MYLSCVIQQLDGGRRTAVYRQQSHRLGTGTQPCAFNRIKALVLMVSAASRRSSYVCHEGAATMTAAKAAALTLRATKEAPRPVSCMAACRLG